MKKDHWLYGVAVVVGIIVWVVVSTVSHRREAWDSKWYWMAGVPVVCVVSAVLGLVEPSRPWRWGAAPLAGARWWCQEPFCVVADVRNEGSIRNRTSSTCE
jgi:hypothetical protein